MRTNKVLLGVALAGTLLFAGKARAIGLSASPSELSGETGRGENITIPLSIKNPSREVAIFEVYPEDFDALIVPIPSRFTLESGEEKTISIKVVPREEGVFATYLSVVARPITDPVLGVASGVKLPFRLRVTDKHPPLLAATILASPPSLAALGGMLFGAGILFAAMRLRRAAKTS